MHRHFPSLYTEAATHTFETRVISLPNISSRSSPKSHDTLPNYGMDVSDAMSDWNFGTGSGKRLGEFAQIEGERF